MFSSSKTRQIIGRLQKLGARFSVGAANLSGNFQVFAGFSGQTQEGKQKKIKET